MSIILPVFIRIAQALAEFGQLAIDLFTTPIPTLLTNNDMLNLGIYNPFTWIVDQVIGDVTLIELMFTVGLGAVLLWGLIKFLLPTS